MTRYFGLAVLYFSSLHLMLGARESFDDGNFLKHAFQAIGGIILLTGALDLTFEKLTNPLTIQRKKYTSLTGVILTPTLYLRIEDIASISYERNRYRIERLPTVWGEPVAPIIVDREDDIQAVRASLERVSKLAASSKGSISLGT